MSSTTHDDDPALGQASDDGPADSDAKGTPSPSVLVYHEPTLMKALDLELLESRSVRVHTFTTGRQAIHAATYQAPCLCLTPLELPDMDGKALAARLLEIYGPDHVTIIALVKAKSPEEAPVNPERFAGLALLPAQPEEIRALMDRYVGIRLRQAERFPVRVRVLANEYPGTTMDLSVTGLLIRTSHPLKPGDKTELKFALPGSTDRMSITGRVVRVEPKRFGLGVVAVRFESISPQDEKRLQEYLTSLSGRRTFWWRVDTEGETMLVLLGGALRKADDLMDLTADISGRIRLDLRDLKKIEPSCIDSWQKWLESLPSDPGPVEVEAMHFDLALQAAQDPRLCSNIKILSIMMPHACESCGSTAFHPVSRVGPAASYPCSRCGALLVCDEEMPRLSDLV